jgi:ribosome-binding protein aMBF1 (putative translation factor)
LAREAKINESAIRKMEEPEWNPETKTLKRLEAIIPPEFDPSDTSSDGDEIGGSQNKCGQ